ncbi:MAG: acyl-CoA dehydrogenase family protein [Acidimicrobiales bacterium]|nr:acyl-CoA dehydrogenase family protein [Acidimicrobiales bacterium]
MTGETEDLEQFRQRARTFVTENLRPSSDAAYYGIRHANTDEDELEAVAHDRAMQRMLFDAGLAGVTVPTEYGGRGLTPAHQRVLNEELQGYEYPARFQVPTMTPCLAVILDFGTEEQKHEHVPAILKGDEIWLQFLSEPGAGSDVAGAVTTAMRDGDEWVLNGSKVWTTGAWWSDWGLCLTRTNWDVPKHRGLTVFMLPIDREGIDVQRIEMLNGNREFCQEFLTDVRVPDTDRIGGVDDGWTVGTRWMFHERMSHNSPLVTQPTGVARTAIAGAHMHRVAQASGRERDPAAQNLIGEAEMIEVVGGALQRRVGQGIATGTMSDQSSAIARLFFGLGTARKNSIAFDLAGNAGVAWTDDDGELAGRGEDYLMRQVSCIGGGTTEMAANVVAERVLGMPRERSGDKDVPFRDVPRGPTN